MPLELASVKLYRRDQAETTLRFANFRLSSLDPAAILEPDSELCRIFVGGRLGSTLKSAPAAGLAINFGATNHNQPDRVGRGNRHRGRHYHSGGFVSGRGKRSRSEFAPALRRDRVAFHNRIHLRSSGTESDHVTLNCAAGAATLYRDQVTADYP